MGCSWGGGVSKRTCIVSFKVSGSITSLQERSPGRKRREEVCASWAKEEDP